MATTLELSPAQRHMYASEKQVNFRWISKLLAKPSPYKLTTSDMAAPDILCELAQIGQFTEVAYGFLKSGPEFIFRNLDMLTEPGFPLEGYDALQGTVLSSSITGTVPAYVAFRPSTRQLVVAISGSCRFMHALYDIHAFKHAHPIGRGCAVHTGFWKIYQGIRSRLCDAIRAGVREHDVAALVITGHSMGGAVSYLLAVDILADSSQIPSGLPIKIVVFGAPRCGNATMSRCWHELVDEYRKKNGEGALQEYSVRGYNDGMLLSANTLLLSKYLTYNQASRHFHL
jgi:hypothetical protein